MLLERAKIYKTGEFDLRQMRKELDREFVNFAYMLYRPQKERILLPKDDIQIAPLSSYHLPTPREMEQQLDDPLWKADTFRAFADNTGIKIREDPDFGRVFMVETDDIDIARGAFAKIRLIYAYLFLSKILPKKQKLLDVGTYDGFGVILLTRLAKNILSIDDDDQMHERAKKHPIIQLLMHPKRHTVRLEKMRAQDIPFTEEFDYVSMIELLTGGFHGTQQDTELIVKNAYRALKAGGEFIFTLPSRSADMIEIFRRANIPEKEEEGKFRPFREHLSPILEEVFGPGNEIYYGQIGSFIDPNGTIHDAIYTWREDFGRGRAHASITSDYLVPRPIGNDDLAYYMYAHYIGRWKKPVP